MARSQANLHLTIFEGLAGLSPSAKLVYVALLVEPTVNQAGVGATRPSRWAKQTGLSLTQVSKALRELDDSRHAFVDDDTEELFVRTLMRNDGVASQPNVLWAACRAARLTRSPRLRAELAKEFRQLPPKPEDKTLRNGRVYVHPDPHAVAEQLDPSPDPENPSRTLPEPFENPSPGEPFSKGSGGVGGGGGGSSVGLHGDTSSVVTVLRRSEKNAAAPSATKRATRIPDDFAVTPAMVEWAREHAPHVDGRFETAQFKDYWMAKAGKDSNKKDWVRTWQVWMRKAEREAGRNNGHRMATSERNFLQTQQLKQRMANGANQLELPRGSQ